MELYRYCMVFITWSGNENKFLKDFNDKRENGSVVNFYTWETVLGTFKNGSKVLSKTWF